MYPEFEILQSDDISDLPISALHSHVVAVQEENMRLEKALSEARQLLQSFIDVEGDEEERADVVARAEVLIEELSVMEEVLQ